MPLLHADRPAVKQILFNLPSNAVNVHWIPRQKTDSVTDPFIRSDSDPHMAQEGSGLSLAIVKFLVELHDGALHLESEVGVGTTMTPTLPKKGAQAPRNSNDYPPSAASPSSPL